MTTGTHTMRDLIEIQDLARQTLIEYGEDNLLADVRADVDAHNDLVDEAVAEYAEVTTDIVRRSGTDSGTVDTELDETGRARTQKSEGGYDVAFPLRTYGYAVGWTAKYLKRATVADMARQTLAAQRAHRARIYREMRKAFFNPTNYTVRDFAATRTMLNVKAVANGDATDYGADAYGAPVSANHTHILANAGLTAALVRTGVNHILEHGSGQIIIEINRADEAAWQALPGFAPAGDPLVIYNGTANQMDAPRNMTVADNRIVGRIEGATVWSRPWVPAGYHITRAIGDRRPLAMRVSTLASERGLYLAGNNSAYPLEADQWEYAFGFGYQNRLGAVITYTGGAAYVAPTF